MAAYQNGYMRTSYPGRSSSMQDCNCQRENLRQRENLCQKEASCDRKTSCDREDFCMEGAFGEFPIGMGYVPWQTWREIYDLEKSFQTGTIFRELDKPFYGRRGSRC